MRSAMAEMGSVSVVRAGNVSAILGVSVNGDVIRMAIADAPTEDVGAATLGRGGSRARATEALDISAYLEKVPAHGTPEEQAAGVLHELILDGMHDGVPIRSVVAAYHDEDQAKRLTTAMDVLGLTNYSLVSAPAAALAALVVGRQIGFARSIAVCNMDSWLYSCGIITVAGELRGGIQTATTESLAAANADVLDGIAAVVDAAARSARHEPDLVVLVGESASEVEDLEFVERDLGRPLIVPPDAAMLVARGASLLPSRPMRGTGIAAAASDSDWAPIATKERVLPDWFPNAAALGGVVALLLVGGLAAAGLGALGIFSSGGGDPSTTDPASTTATTSVAPPADPPSQAPALSTLEPTPTPAPAPAPVEQAPAPAPVPQPAPAPAPAAPVIQIPGLPPIVLPVLPGG